MDTNSFKPLIFYVNPAWRRKGVHTPILNPWWGNPYDKESLISRKMFDSYSFDTSCYGITHDIKRAEMVLVPYIHRWLLKNDRALFDECISVAQEFGLPILIDGSGDIEYPIHIKNSFVLRYGGYRFLPADNRIQIPLFVDDLLERYENGNFKIREKTEEKPIIGFAGWTRLSSRQYIRTIIKELPLRFRALFNKQYYAGIRGIWWRRKTIRILQKSSRITSRFELRNSFSANPKTVEGDMKQLQKEMTDIIIQSDYALDIRGDANNSARLFEILSLGRIPVIVDTERNFPFKDVVDYSSFALIIDFRDLHELPERIAEFHDSISPERFKEMQIKARYAYVRYFRIDGVMKEIIKELRKKIHEANNIK